jgi:glyoxylase-like metal-dependent hydrolase (beta-lactamase superfamily II)
VVASAPFPEFPPHEPDGGVPSYRVYAVKYAEREARRAEHFHPDFGSGDPHDTESMPMDYFVWAVIGDDRTWVVDTGFGPDDAARRGRRLLRTAAEALRTIDVDAATVTDVIITHLHYDHVGGFEQFPSARFHVQDREVAFATGRHMTTPSQQHAFTPGHIADFVLAVHAGRVVFHDGDDQVAPGLSVHHVGGHTDGMQVVRVNTDRGWLVLASDAAHYYENLDSRRPFPIVFDVAAMLAGFDRVRQLAEPPDLYVPGHDPDVLRRHPAASPELAGVACRLA